MRVKRLLLLVLLIATNLIWVQAESGSPALPAVDAADSLSLGEARITLLKSIVLPGWGEHSLGHKTRGYLFNGTELGIWVSWAAFQLQGAALYNDMQAYAAEHAGVDISGKDEVYFTDIGNYNTIYEYNDQKLRYRQSMAVYPTTEDYVWAWDTENSREEFDDIRIRQARVLRNAGFALTGLVINRLVSIFDVMLLTRGRVETPLEDFETVLAPTRDGVNFSLYFHFR